MGTITTLGIILLILMLLVDGNKIIGSYLSLIINFGILFFSVVLMALGFPPLVVTIVASVVVLAITIFWSNASDRSSNVAFKASLIVLFLLIILIIIVEKWALVGGFGIEESEELEGLSILVGTNFTKIAISTVILSALGAISEAAIAISSGLDEIIDYDDNLPAQRILINGQIIGQQIIGTAVNTLFFGFFGSSLALFIWFSDLHYSLGQIINDKLFVAQLISILIAIIGVILIIPVTTYVMYINYKKTK
ncbi:YibE/F family protein [Lentilactobacillus laojiaonis]|uniref:YibE/F family protein n=1 Tax=Lentilactobacillus laojiaonis TaxID=2883998 RepID=UPI001D09FBB2|nr:YibE/F family protein [Lentilactobacillus laojiaonis]UDM32273.1 YibE/F family protein [Lentilactobacillus laojiaonis]